LRLHTQLRLQKLDNLEFTEPYPEFKEEVVLVGNGTSIVVSLSILEELYFTVRGHDVLMTLGRISTDPTALAIILVLLNLVKDAYFSKESGFNHTVQFHR